MSAPGRIVVLAGSAGCLPTIFRIVSSIEHGGDAALFVVYHRAAGGAFDWSPFLRENKAFAAETAMGAKVRRQVLFHALDSHDMIVKDGLVVSAQTEERPRPNIDRFLESVSGEYGDRVVAFLLSGLGKDGIRGLHAVRRRGGRAIVQRPASASFPELPLRAIEEDSADEVMGEEALVRRATDLLAGRAAVVSK